MDRGALTGVLGMTSPGYRKTSKEGQYVGDSELTVGFASSWQACAMVAYDTTCKYRCLHNLTVYVDNGCHLLQYYPRYRRSPPDCCQYSDRVSSLSYVRVCITPLLLVIFAGNVNTRRALIGSFVDSTSGSSFLGLGLPSLTNDFAFAAIGNSLLSPARKPFVLRYPSMIPASSLVLLIPSPEA